MNRWLVRAGALLALVSLTAGMANAQDKMSGKKAPAECPVCKMKLATKKTKDATVAVQLKKGAPTLYCCAKCKMPADVLVKEKAAPKKSTKM